MTRKNIDVKGKAIIGKMVGIAYSIQQLCGSELNLCHLDIRHCWKKIKAMKVFYILPSTKIMVSCYL